MASAAITPTSAPVGSSTTSSPTSTASGNRPDWWVGPAAPPGALAAAAQSDAVAAVAPFEPGILSLMDEQDQAVIGNAVARTGELAAEGNLTAAARAFAGFPFNDEEIAVAEDAGYFEAAGRYVPNLLNLLQQAMAIRRPNR